MKMLVTWPPELHPDTEVRVPEAPTEKSEEIEVPTLTEQPLIGDLHAFVIHQYVIEQNCL